MADITHETVEAALKDVRRGARLRASPLLGLRLLRARLARVDRAVTDANLEEMLRDVLCEIVGAGLAAARGLPDRSALEARHAASAIESDLMADFDAGDRDREAWSTLYHRYTAPLPMEVREITRVTRAPSARNHERQILRRSVLGYEKLAAHLRRIEDDLASISLGVPTPPVPPVTIAPHNLPARRNRFIGRAAQLAEVESDLEGGALVTLVGPGGVGKTRLAQEVARRQLARWPGGAWWADFSDLGEADPVLPTVARAVGVVEPIDRLSPDVVAKSLAGRRALLLLDNCEHVLHASARLADDLLSRCPDLCIVATSRHRLMIEGERHHDVRPLDVPTDDRAAATPEQLLHNESVALFVDRAAEVQHGFRLDGRNAPPIGRLCRSLDGIPLAIELAAGRMRTLLSVEVMLAQLDDPLAILTHGLATAPDRQKTMLKAIEWSYKLLSDPEKTLFARLAVFRGGWSFEAAGRVCTDAEVTTRDLLEGLGSLVEHSLVQADPTSAQPRYRFLDLIRHFAHDRLEAQRAPRAVRQRHLEFFVALVEAAEPELTRADQAEWLRRLDQEYANLLAALDFALTDGHTTLGLRLASALWRYWDARGNAGDGRTRLAGLLAAAGEVGDEAAGGTEVGAGGADTGAREMTAGRSDTGMDQRARESVPDAVRAAALHAAGVLAMNQADYGPAMAMFEEAAEIRRRLGDWRGLGRTLGNIGAVHYILRDFPAARNALLQSRDAGYRAGDDLNVGNALLNLSLVSRQCEDWKAASNEASESLKVFEHIGDKEGMASARHKLALIEYFQGDQERAGALLRKALNEYEAYGGHKLTVAEVRRDLACIRHNLGDYAEAEREFKLSLEVCMESRNYWTACTTLNHLGHLSTDTQNFSSGLAHFEKARQLSVDVNHVIAQGAAHVGTARVAIYLGDLAKAREAICSSLKIAATLPSERQVLPWLATYVRFLSALGQMPEAAQLYALYQAHHERYKWRLSPLQTKELSDASITLPTAPIGTPTETGDVVRLTCRFLGCCCLAPGTAV